MNHLISFCVKMSHYQNFSLRDFSVQDSVKSSVQDSVQFWRFFGSFSFFILYRNNGISVKSSVQDSVQFWRFCGSFSFFILYRNNGISVQAVPNFSLPRNFLKTSVKNFGTRTSLVVVGRCVGGNFQKRIVIYYNFRRVFHRFRLRNVHLRP